MTENLIQTGAFALWQADAIRATGKPRREAWDDVANDEKARWAATFCAAQSLLNSAGYAIVPVEPTEEMLNAGRGRARREITVPDWMHPHGYAPAYAYYRAMIEATK